MGVAFVLVGPFLFLPREGTLSSICAPAECSATFEIDDDRVNVGEAQVSESSLDGRLERTSQSILPLREAGRARAAEVMSSVLRFLEDVDPHGRFDRPVRINTENLGPLLPLPA